MMRAQDDFTSFYHFSNAKNYDETVEKAQKSAKHFSNSVFSSLFNESILSETKKKKSEIYGEAKNLKNFLETEIKRSARQ